ncbi:MAG: DUF1036 domain-containing protein [Hyphomonadaceae bacterium]|nr:DUF1036 domain-containing protein [Hyphomonadaceae bacterium]
MDLERWSLKLLGIAVFVLAVWGLSGTPAQAQQNGWRLCNKTSYIINAAVARPEGQAVVVEGWTKLRPGTCETALSAPLTPGVHFIYGQSSDAHRGGGRDWGGDRELCVDPTGSFSVESPPDCGEFGLDARNFRPVLIERRTSWQTTFTETNQYTTAQAEAAGVQRLLEDAGVFSGRVDGLLGRETRAAIREFLNSQGLAADTSDTDLIDFLEQSAIERAREVGFTLCNRTDYPIWGAVARMRGDEWESRGWWRLEASGCARVIDRPLNQRQYFVYGEMEQGDGRVRTLKRASEPFCVSRAKFAIAGREECESAAYRTALFTETAVPEDQKLVFEFFERDFDRARDAPGG